MINNDQEYVKMSEAESQHWWYKSLHWQCFKRVVSNFTSKNIELLDAGCGTGGLLSFMKERGYQNLSGIDISEKAIELCTAKGIQATVSNILDIDKLYEADSVDVVFCNDVIYFLSEEEQVQFLAKLDRILKKDGIAVINFPSLKAFQGIHDIVVGIDNRFNTRKVKHLVEQSNFKITRYRFWPFSMSPIIFLVRILQKLKLKLQPNAKIESDVEVPSPLVNGILHGIVRTELAILPNYPWGSSALATLKKKS